ncbi:hypothetical protein EB74_16955 [Mycobacterium sp. SWH-M5]|nr:hypothetical protein EB74_16955 [Mycobacterium sp. SWH-M5]
MVLARTIRARLYHSCMAGDDLSEKYLTLSQIAERNQWTLKTARNRQHEANRRRREGRPRPGDLPAPDHHIGRTPLWRVSTIDAWEKNRPGQGAGGGPKPRR